MLQSLPDETTQLLIDLCTTTGPLVQDEADAVVTVSPTKATAAGPSYLSYLALNRGVTVPTTVSSETATPPSPSLKTVRADNASTRREPSIITQDVGVAAASGSRSSTPPTTSNRASMIRDRMVGLASGFPTPSAPPVRKLSPRIYFPHFVDHMEQFVIFLETVAMRRWRQSVEDMAPGTIGLLGSDGQVSPVIMEDEQGVLLDKMDQVAVWNTLLELYLTLPLRGGGGTAKEGGAGEQGTPKKTVFDEQTMRDKAMRVLRSDVIPYDSTHALILCSTHGFTLGLVLLWEKEGMYEDVLRFWMDKDREGNTPGASQKVIDHLMQYGREHPHLYQLVLRFLSSTPELLKRHQNDLKEVVEYIDEEGIMPPLGIIQVLSRNEVASIGLVKEWLIKRITVSQMGIHDVSHP
jgi:hypothetical protein